MAATLYLEAFRGALQCTRTRRSNERPAILRLTVKPLLTCPILRFGTNCRVSRYDWLIVALVPLGALVRMSLLEQPGFGGDLYGSKRWGLFAVEHGLLRIYELSDVNYPPLAVLLRWCEAQLARLINPAFGLQDPGLAIALDSVTYTALVKGAASIADLLIGVLVYRWARQTAGPQWAAAAAAAILLHPALSYVSAWWGQIDSLFSLGQIAAFLAADRGQVRRSAVFYALAGLVKVQAFILLPVFAVLQWQRGGLRRMLHSGEVLVSVLVLAALPFFLVGQGANLFRSSGQAGGLQRLGSFGSAASPTNNAYNIWWLALDPEERRQSDLQPQWGSLPRRAVGLTAFAAAYLLVLIWMWRWGPRYWAAAAVAVYASFFMLPTQIHERHLLPFFPLMVVALIYHRHLIPWFVGWSITFTANLLHVGGLVGLPCRECFTGVLGILTPERIAGINVVLWVTLLLMLLWLPASRPERQSAARSQDEPAAASP